MHDRIARQVALLGAVLALMVVSELRLVRGDDGAQPSSAQSGAADGISVELLDGTRITGKANVEQIAVETASGTFKVPLADLVGFTPGLDSRPDLAKRVSTLIAALGSDSFAEREGAQRELTEMGPMLRLIVAEHANDADAERQHRVAQILTAYETWAARHPEAPSSSTIPMNRQDQTQTSSGKHVGRITQKQFSLETDYGTFRFELRHVFQAARVRIAPARKQDKETYPAMIELRNGSYLKGDLGPSNIRIRVDGPYGEASIPLSLLNSVTVQDDRKTIDVALKNGDRLKGSLAGSGQLEVKTASGPRLILPNETTRISLCGAAIVPSKGLVLHLPLDEKMEKVRDQSGKGNHGTICGATWTPKGKVGGAYEFDGIDDYVALPPNLLTGKRQVTIAAWIKVTNTSKTKYIYSRYGQSKPDQFYVQAKTLRVVLDVASSQGRWAADSIKPLSENTWQHVAAVYDSHLPVAGKIVIYVDGQRASAPAVESNGGDGALGVNQEFLSCPQLAGQTDATVGRFKGCIDEVVVFDRALTETEIKNIFDSRR